MAPSRVGPFIEAIKAISTGCTHETVIARLGAPYEIKTIRGMKSDSPTNGFSITYYLQKERAGIANEIQDKYISIAFDNSNKLTDILTNIEGLSDNLIYSSGKIKLWRILGVNSDLSGIHSGPNSSNHNSGAEGSAISNGGVPE
jgi:hypothetical protein